MAAVPEWHLEGDWFDVCSCDVPCPCTFAQAPTDDHCEGVLAWHVRAGRYGDVVLDGLNAIGVGTIEGNAWAGGKVTMGMFLDARGDDRQRDALGMIFGGKAGGWPAEFAKIIAEVRGVEVAPIEFEVAGDLAYWRAAIPGKVDARGEALTGPTTLPGQRVQTLNPPGCETGPNGVATWGRSSTDRADCMGFAWNRSGQSSKHIPFDWRGPGAS